ncbi:MAG TPA: XRE family transcriptional regulator [Thermomicrobiales bacterium]|nr:XRE family transcriptional regulator [Thermomicrobiales bacterium]
MADHTALVLARAVRDRRLGLEWTIDQLVSRSGVSKGAIVAVENGTTNPSLSTLVRLADALGVPVSDLLGDSSAATVRTVDHDSCVALWQGPNGGHASLIATVPGASPVELWTWVLMAGEHYVSHPHPHGVMETITVLAGELELTVDGEVSTIPGGTTAMFVADRQHAYAARNQNASFVMTVHLGASHGRGTG